MRIKLLFLLCWCLIVNSYAAPANTHLKPFTYYMNILIHIAQHQPSAPFAAMIVNKETGKILCTGLNKSTVSPDLHGEVVAINTCAREYPKLNWHHTMLISTAEPCPMCMSAIIWTGISTVVYGTSLPTLEHLGWYEINIRAKTIVNYSTFYHGKIIGGIAHQKTDPLFLRS